jgi:glyoxylase-like metal-dependent hydrolase (beta-lactamase superfamily II)
MGERRHAATNADDKHEVAEAWTDADQQLVTRLSLATDKPFPKRFLNDESLPVYWLGHHNEASFGATPYLLQTQHKGQNIHIMIDTPKFSPSSIRAVEQITGSGVGPDYLFLTHVDDTADHLKWAQHYAGRLKRIFHAGDLGVHNWIGDPSLETVEVLLPKPKPGAHDTTDAVSGASLMAYSLDGEVLKGDWMTTTDDAGHKVVILHTPGHSPGSITLWDRVNDLLFTGDTYAWTTREGGRMSGFPRYGNDLRLQAETLRRLLTLSDWVIVAPGHGHPRDYRGVDSVERVKEEELKVALEELARYSR